MGWDSDGLFEVVRDLDFWCQNSLRIYLIFIFSLFFLSSLLLVSYLTPTRDLINKAPE